MSEAPSVEAFRAKVRAWLAAHVPRKRPDERLLDWDDESVARDRAIQRSLWQGGITGVALPIAYGGLGLSPAHAEAFREEAADYRMPEVFGNGFNVVIPTLLAHASEAQKKHFIPRILRGDDIWCQFLSEPSGGSDLAGLLTRAERDGDRWRLNGAKIWTTGANYSDYAICLARTDPRVPKHAGLTMFIVPMTNPGITVVPLALIDGSADFCQEYLDDVSIAADHVIGEVDDGWRVARTLLMNERAAVGTGWSLGGRRGETREAGIELPVELLEIARAQGRERDPRVRGLIGESWVINAVQGQTARRVGAAMRSGELPGDAAALLKAMSGVGIARQGEIAIEVAGSAAIAWAPGSGSRWGYRRLFSHGIGGGTTEMQRNAIAERLLDLPREPSPDRELPFDQLRHNVVPRPKKPAR